MLFKNSQFQRENFIGFKLRDFLNTSQNEWAIHVGMTAKPILQDIIDEGREPSLEEIEDVASTLIREARITIMEDVAAFINKTYPGKGDAFMDLFNSMLEDSSIADNYRLSASEIFERGPDAIDIYTIATNVIFPEQLYTPSFGQPTKFLETVSQLMIQSRKNEITYFTAIFAKLVRDGIIKDLPDTVKKMSSQAGVDYRKILTDSQ